MRKLLSTLCIIFSTVSFIHAQQPASYTPFKDDSLQLDVIKKAIRDNYLKDSVSIQGENKKYTVGMYRERIAFINQMFTDKEFIFTEETNKYLTSLVNEIFKANPQLRTLGTHFLFSRAYWPNAFSTGEGTIVFNIGLFIKLQNESQVVFTLCHELAHLYLNHSNKAIDHYISTLYSEEFQARLKELKKQQYERNKELAKLEKGVVFSGRRHGRQHESEADSMGLVFMKSTGFDVTESLACLAILDNIDKDTYNAEEGMRTLFNFPEYPFQNKWIKKEEAFFGISADNKPVDKDEDSLKTHPDCKVRIARLEPSVKMISNAAAKKFMVDEAEFKKLQRLFALETLPYCINSKRISRCLYLAMELYKQDPSNAYVVTTIGKCFNLLYEHQKDHTLNNIVSLPSPMGEKNYNSLLEFIQKLNLQDMASIGYYFLKQHEATFAADKDFAAAYNQSKINFKNP
ncbi:M48 family metalloprotease [Ferruginibacter sp.]